MTTVLVTEFMDEVGLQLLGTDSEVRYHPEIFGERHRLLDLVADVDGLVVRNRTQVNAELIDRAVALRAVGRLGVGLDNIDVEACRERGISIHTAGTANADSVAEYVIAALFALHRPALLGTRRIIEGEWPRTESVGREIAGRRLGLVGLGATSAAVARRALAVGMIVSGYDPYTSGPPGVARYEDLDRLLSASDAISVHVPLLPDTRHLIDARRLALLPEGAVLVDASRGGVVDHAAVIDALASGRLAGASLDVFEDEPPDPTPYQSIPHLILTPHIAGLTHQSNARVASTVARGVMDALT